MKPHGMKPHKTTYFFQQEDTLKNELPSSALEKYIMVIEGKVIPKIKKLQQKKDRGADNARKLGITYRTHN